MTFTHTLTGDGNYHRPYTWADPESTPLADIREAMIRRKGRRMSKGIAIVSGGLDSTTMIYHLLKEGHELDLLSFNYGQRHAKELQFAAATARQLGLNHDIVDLTGLTHLISNSALTSQTGLTVRGMNFDGEGFRPNIDVPDGHYAEENMKQTVVPNRNMIMLSIAAGVAVNRQLEFVATGVHSGDHFIYPDCRDEFIEYAARAMYVGNEGFHNFNTGLGMHGPILTPFIEQTKADIVYRALELGVPLHLTWSCYKGGEKHCGRCGTCVERLEAIDEAIRRTISEGAGAPYAEDMTEYVDNEYWRVAVREAKNG